MERHEFRLACIRPIMIYYSNELEDDCSLLSLVSQVMLSNGLANCVTPTVDKNHSQTFDEILNEAVTLHNPQPQHQPTHF